VSTVLHRVDAATADGATKQTQHSHSHSHTLINTALHAPLPPLHSATKESTPYPPCVLRSPTHHSTNYTTVPIAQPRPAYPAYPHTRDIQLTMHPPTHTHSIPFPASACLIPSNSECTVFQPSARMCPLPSTAVSTRVQTAVQSNTQQPITHHTASQYTQYTHHCGHSTARQSNNNRIRYR